MAWFLPNGHPQQNIMSIKSPLVLILSFSLFGLNAQIQNDFLFHYGASSNFSGDFLRDIATDEDGNIYVSGKNAGNADVDPGPGIEDVSSYVAKYNSNYDLVWAANFLGAGDVFGVSVTPNGDVYACGEFSTEADFDPGLGVYALTPQEIKDGFVVKLNDDGLFQWAFALESTYTSRLRGICTDDVGSVYVGGTFSGDVDVDPSGAEEVYSGNLSSNGVLAKYDSNGNYQWSHALLTSGNSRYTSLDCKSGDLVVAGWQNATSDMDPGLGENIPDWAGFFAESLDPETGDLIWVNGIQPVMGSGTTDPVVQIDWEGNVYLAALPNGQGFVADPENNGTETPLFGAEDAAVVKYNSQGVYQWSNHYGAPGNDPLGIELLVTPGPIFLAHGSPDLSIQRIESSGEDTYDVNLVSGISFISALHFVEESLVVGGNFMGDLYPNPTEPEEMISSAGHFDSFWGVYSEINQAPEVEILNAGVELCSDFTDEFYFIADVTDENLETLTIDVWSTNDSVFPTDEIEISLVDETIGIVITLLSQDEVAEAYLVVSVEDEEGLLALDSTLVTLFPNYHQYLFEEICEGESIEVGNQEFDTSGEYLIEMENIYGCDSIAELDLTVFPSHFIVSDLITVCEGDSVELWGEFISVAGIYDLELETVHSCDSLIEQEVIISILTTEIVFNNGQLSVEVGMDSYQWIDCNTNEPVDGAASPDFIPTESGSYAVELALGACSALSECLEVIVTDVTSIETADELIYPNPVTDFLYVRASRPAFGLDVYSAQGQLLKSFNSIGAFPQLSLSWLSAGSYIVVLRFKDGSVRKELLVKI